MTDKLEEKYRALLGEYAYALKWSRDKIEELEDENDRLKKIIVNLTGINSADKKKGASHGLTS